VGVGMAATGDGVERGAEGGWASIVAPADGVAAGWRSGCSCVTSVAKTRPSILWKQRPAAPKR